MGYRLSKKEDNNLTNSTIAFWNDIGKILVRDDIYGDELDDAIVGEIDYTISCEIF